MALVVAKVVVVVIVIVVIAFAGRFRSALCFMLSSEQVCYCCVLVLMSRQQMNRRIDSLFNVGKLSYLLLEIRD